MRKFLLAAVAAAAIASPALARDGSTYVGAEGGISLVEDTKFDFRDPNNDLKDAVSVGYGTGFDLDLIAGHDFGMIRTEVELGYKHAGVDEVVLGQGACATSVQNCVLDADGNTHALSAMLNGLLDFGGDDGIGGYAGVGVGFAKVKVSADFSTTAPTIPTTDFGFDDSDSTFAWQLIAGLRFPVSPNIDVGAKYRFFNASSLDFRDSSNDARLWEFPCPSGFARFQSLRIWWR